MYNISSEDKYKLLELTSTAKGVLRKYIDEKNGYYYKTGIEQLGIYENKTVFAEIISYEIGELLGLDVLKQELDEMEIDGEKITVCSSKNFLNDGETFISIRKYSKSIISYEDLKKEFPQFMEYFNSILIFDFIINNTDRHLNNFGLIFTGDDFRTPPIFDNGMSLLAELDNEKIKLFAKNPYRIKKADSSKPFLKKHYKQIELIEKLPEINLDFSDEEIENIISKYYHGDRKEAVMIMLKERLDYVRKIYSKI